MEDTTGTKASVRRSLALAGSVGLCLVASACYWLQPDWLAAATLAPEWFWLLPALALVRAGYRRDQWRLSVVVLGLWLLFTVVFVEEARSLVRFGRSPTAEWIAAREHGRAVRVVSLNCCMGNAKAAAEVAQYGPDIVLLQESPSQDAVEELALELFGAEGDSLWSRDTSILARGQIVPGADHGPSCFTHAGVKLSSGLELDVVSLRLNPPVSRLDFWSPGFWRAHRDNRVKHRRQIQEVMDGLGELPASAHVIVGGDFNVPADDGALASLRPRLLDTFRKAGRGWGNTGTNEFPLFRVDQIWASGGFRAESVTARRTVHSDHRVVVCDLVVEE